MCTFCQACDPSISTLDLHGVTSLVSGDVTSTYSEGAASGGTSSAGLPVFSNDQIADYLINGFWEDKGGAARSFNVATGGTITVNLDGLTALGAQTALTALEAWSAVSGLVFAQSATAMITFDDTYGGAYASSYVSGGTILRSSINIDDAWSQYGGYYLQTFIHEIGHALGLGHSGNYNGSASYGSDSHFANDSWQATVMSYFDQYENTSINASRLYLATAQLADIAAIHQLYGTPGTVAVGNSVYGDGATGSQFGMDLPVNNAIAIYDSGGIDLIDLGSRTSYQMLDLRSETYSNINGRTGNLSIARETVIENAITGSGFDRVIGNAADNRIDAGAGNDTISGHGGDDVLIGGLGEDILSGGAGADHFVFNGLADAGDTILDITLSEGDQIDISAVLTAIGYSGTSPQADGIVALEATTGGSYLVVDPDGAGGVSGTRIAFLTGIDASKSVAQLIGMGDPLQPETGSENNTVFVISNDFLSGWTVARGTISDDDGGIDTLDLSAFTYTSVIHLSSGAVGRVGSRALTVAENTTVENLIMGQGNDRGYGNAGNNLIEGRNGIDRLFGLDGDDTLIGGAGIDRLVGGAGHDSLSGGAENDYLNGGDGRDTLMGDIGDDKLFAGAGDDVLYAGDGDDYMRGDVGNDTIDAGLGVDRVYAGLGDDSVLGGGGHDLLRGDAGNDTLDGGTGNDSLFGLSDDDDLHGGAGDDYIRGGTGFDEIEGGAGADLIYGDADDDVIAGGDGIDFLKGGDGNDAVNGGSGDDIIYGDAGHDTLSGGSGKDYVNGGAGNDVLYGGDGDDLLLASTGDDILSAGTGNDQLNGGYGQDTLIGGIGADLLKGGADADVFVFNALDEVGDTIWDLSLLSGDKVDVSGLLNGLGLTTADALANGNLSLAAHGRNAWLELDMDGPAGAEAVQVTYIRNLSSLTELSENWLI